jgi:hypothetical protein
LTPKVNQSVLLPVVSSVTGVVVAGLVPLVALPPPAEDATGVAVTDDP